jgi:hypothetical protein
VTTELGFELLHYRLKTVDDLKGAFAAGVVARLIQKKFNSKFHCRT